MTRILDGAGNLFKVVMKCLKEQNCIELKACIARIFSE